MTPLGLPLRLARGELRVQPWSFLAVAVITAVGGAFTAIVLTFLVLATGEVGATWRSASMGSLEDDLTGAAMVLVFVAVPTIVVVSNVGAGAIANLRHPLMTWRLAGATPYVCAGTVLLQLVVTAAIGAAVGVVLVIPALSSAVGLIIRMAGADPALISVPPQPLAMIGAVVLVTFLCVVGGLKPALVAARESATSVLRVAALASGTRSRARLILAVAGSVASIVLVVVALNGGLSGQDIDSVLSGAMGVGAVVVLTVTVAGPWLYPATVDAVGRLLGARIWPELFFARSLLVSRRQLTVSVTGSLFLAVGLVGVFSGVLATFAAALNRSGAPAELNLIDTIVLIGPPIIIGMAGAIGRLVVAWSDLVEEFRRYRLAGARLGGLWGTSAAGGILIGFAGGGLGMAVGVVTMLVTAQMLDDVGWPTSSQLSWDLLCTIVLCGALLIVMVLGSAAWTGYKMRR